MKSELRKTLLSARKSLSPELVAEKSGQILERLKNSQLLDHRNYILCYMDFRNEVQTQPIIQHVWSLGKTLVLPRVNTTTKMLDLCLVSQLSDLVSGSMGILEPASHCQVLTAETIDLVLAPGVGFDLSGFRMGYGGGFYDKLIPMLRTDCPVVALAFEVQLVPKLPTESHDMPMNGIITESRTLFI